MTSYWNNKDFVLLGVQQYGYCLQHAWEELKNDRDVVLAAIERSGGAVQFASKELRGDREIMMAALQRNDTVLKYASEELRRDLHFLWELEQLHILKTCDVDPQILLQLENFTTMKPAKR